MKSEKMKNCVCIFNWFIPPVVVRMDESNDRPRVHNREKQKLIEISSTIM